ncbi:hypothetical protein scyTo_0022824 [Scyliorhinus torazame]|uniref:Uncharacterized protein n=1 Tax=Scyliorhinus torazame TaxID=75743 RepID=A0A401Q8I2_SCYTO|nr:hypothetical protein [Scyliorhinus torazame]
MLGVNGHPQCDPDEVPPSDASTQCKRTVGDDNGIVISHVCSIGSQLVEQLFGDEEDSGEGSSAGVGKHKHDSDDQASGAGELETEGAVSAHTKSSDRASAAHVPAMSNEHVACVHGLLDEKNMIQHVMQSYHRMIGNNAVRNFRVTYKRHVLTMDDLSTLYGQNWLNDQVTFRSLLTLLDWRRFVC